MRSMVCIRGSQGVRPSSYTATRCARHDTPCTPSPVRWRPRRMTMACRYTRRCASLSECTPADNCMRRVRRATADWTERAARRVCVVGGTSDGAQLRSCTPDGSARQAVIHSHAPGSTRCRMSRATGWAGGAPGYGDTESPKRRRRFPLYTRPPARSAQSVTRPRAINRAHTAQSVPSHDDEPHGEAARAGCGAEWSQTRSGIPWPPTATTVRCRGGRRSAARVSDCAVGSGEWAEPHHYPWALHPTGLGRGGPDGGPDHPCPAPVGHAQWVVMGRSPETAGCDRGHRARGLGPRPSPTSPRRHLRRLSRNRSPRSMAPHGVVQPGATSDTTEREVPPTVHTPPTTLHATT